MYWSHHMLVTTPTLDIWLISIHFFYIIVQIIIVYSKYRFWQLFLNLCSHLWTIMLLCNYAIILMRFKWLCDSYTCSDILNYDIYFNIVMLTNWWIIYSYFICNYFILDSLLTYSYYIRLIWYYIWFNWIFRFSDFFIS